MGIPPQTEQAKKEAAMVGCALLILMGTAAVVLIATFFLAFFFFTVALSDLIYVGPSTLVIGTLVVSTVVAGAAHFGLNGLREILNDHRQGALFYDGNEDSDNF